MKNSSLQMASKNLGFGPSMNRNASSPTAASRTARRTFSRSSAIIRAARRAAERVAVPGRIERAPVPSARDRELDDRQREDRGEQYDVGQTVQTVAHRLAAARLRRRPVPGTAQRSRLAQVSGPCDKFLTGSQCGRGQENPENPLLKGIWT